MSETTQPSWTIKRLLDWTDQFFTESGSGHSRLDAEILLAEALGCARIELYTRFDETPDDKTLVKFRDWVKRRAAGEPVAYLVGYREFYSLRFMVDSNVLIPRPETEHLVVAALEYAKQIDDRPIRILDVGTGSGCIAITIAKYLNDCKVGAIDLMQAAIDVAQKNANHHDVSDRVFFYPGDLYEALPAGSAPVHMIVSNPPYIGTSERETVNADVKDYEPAEALFSGTNGTELIQRLLAESPQRLVAGGHLIMEASPIIMDVCRKLVTDNPAWELVEVIKDYASLQRVIVCRKRS